MMLEGWDKMKEIDDFFGKPGEPVPVVDAADLKAMRAYGRELAARYPGVVGAIGLGVWKQICKPGADIAATAYRSSVLKMLEMEMCAAWTGGELSENAFKVAAKMDLKWMAVGVVYEGLPVNLEEFLAEVQREAA
jgi:hypothetical protein